MKKLLVSSTHSSTKKICNLCKRFDNSKVIFDRSNSSALSLSKVITSFAPTSVEELRKIVNENDIKCGSGDSLPEQVVSDHIERLLPVWKNLVHLSIFTGSMEGVKLADVTPLIKSPALDKELLRNYRPISNLMCIGKFTERVVLKRLNDHMDLHQLHV